MAIKHIIKNVLAKTQAKAKEKLKVAIEQRKGLDVARGQQYTLGQWMGVWYEYYAQIKPADEADHAGSSKALPKAAD